MNPVSLARYLRLVSALAITVAPAAWAAVRTWDGGTTGTDTAWLTPANWSVDVIPGFAGSNFNGDVATFRNIGTGNPISLDMTGLPSATFSLAAIDWSRTVGDTLTNGSALAENSGVLRLNSTAVNRVNNTLILVASSNNLTIADNGAGLFGVALGAANGLITVNANSTLTISSVVSSVSSGNGFTKNGVGTLTLSNTNTYSGNTTVNAGTLLATKALALPSYASTGKVVFNGGTLAVQVGGTGWTTGEVNTLLSNATKTSGALGIDTSGGNLAQWTAFTTSNLGPLGLTKLGPNTLTLNQINTYTGGTTIRDGTLLISSPSALPGYNTPGKVVFDGGTLGVLIGGKGRWTDRDVDNLLVNATKTSGALGIDTSLGSLTQWTAFTPTNLGALGLAKLGSNTLTLNASNTYTGDTLIEQGTLILTSTLGSGTYAGNIKNNGIFVYNSVSDQTLSGVIAGTGGLIKDPSLLVGTLTLTGTNTFTGSITVHGGTVAVGGAGTLGSGSYAGTISNDATFAYNSSANQVLSGVLSGTGLFVKSGTGTLSLTASNTYTGPTTISQGTLAITGSGHLNRGNYARSISNNGTFAYASSTDQILSGVISGTGELVKSGVSILRLTGSYINSGNITINAGSLIVSHLGSGNYAGDIRNAGTFAFDSSTAQILSGLISGTGELVKSGTSMLTLSGNNTYTGTTTISQGGLAITGNGTLGSGTYAGAITNNGTFSYASSANQTLTGPISGTGALSKTGSGVLTLSANNTYSGNTTLTTGVITASHASALGATSSGTSVGTGAALQLQGGVNFAAEALSLSGTGIANDGALRNLSGNNTYRGAITATTATRINSDSGTLTLNVSSGNAITGSNVDVSFGGAGNVTVADPIALGTGGVSKDGDGTLSLSAANTYSGDTTISQGTLALTGSGTLGSGTYAGAITNNGTFAFASSANQTLSGLVSGTGVLTKDGAGVLTLSAANTYSGGTVISAGTLALTGDGTLGSGPISSSGGIIDLGGKTLSNPLGALTGDGQIINGSFLNNSGSYEMQNGTVGTVLTGDNEFNKTGPGTVTLTTASTYTGNTIITAGTLALGASGTFDNSPVINLGTSGSQGTLDLTAKTDSFTFGTDQTVSGYGTINIGAGKTVIIEGALAPGNSPGITEVIGSLTMAPTTDTFMEIAGRGGVAGTDFDQVQVTETLTFAGDLFIDLGSLTGLTDGDSFFLFDAATYVAGLDSVSISSTYYTPPSLVSALGVWAATDAASSLSFIFTEATGTLTITVIPEPSAVAALAGLGVIALALSRRRRQQKAGVALP